MGQKENVFNSDGLTCEAWQWTPKYLPGPFD